MNSLDTLTVVAAVAGSCAAALLGWLLGARGARRGQPEAQAPRTWRSAVTAFIVLGAAAAAFVAPIISVLWMVIALNFLLGQRENIPFSTYAMFSMPSPRAWTLCFEDSDGQLIAISKIGLAPHVVRKRFETELQTARRRGIHDMGEARRSAAAVLAAVLEQHRPPRGPLAATPITIVLMEYVLESGRLHTVHTPILETTPG
jgi:hypothetical protein